MQCLSHSVQLIMDSLTWLLIAYLITMYCFVSDDVKVEPKVEVKVEKINERPVTSQGSNKAPPEKKPKLIR